MWTKSTAFHFRCIVSLNVEITYLNVIMFLRYHYLPARFLHKRQEAFTPWWKLNYSILSGLFVLYFISDQKVHGLSHAYLPASFIYKNTIWYRYIHNFWKKLRMSMMIALSQYRTRLMRYVQLLKQDVWCKML